MFPKPSKELMIGSITWGSFSLRRGSGFGIGVIKTEALLDISKRDVVRLVIGKFNLLDMLTDNQILGNIVKI
jgi:hypothetical protein